MHLEFSANIGDLHIIYICLHLHVNVHLYIYGRAHARTSGVILGRLNIG